jgi:tRNA 2-thiouridine synthesizing protein A
MGKTALNFKGMSCPMPIIRTSMAVKKGISGDVFEITSNDPGFEPDIKAWCNETGNALTGVTKSGKDIIALITKK